jgi:hypothetical protein
MHSGRLTTAADIDASGTALRDLALIERKQRIVQLLGKSQVIRFTGTPTDEGPTMFRHVCRIIGGHRVEADGSALPQRAVKDVAQTEEPGERGGTPGARRRDISLVSQPSCPNGLQDAGDQNHAHGRSMVSEVLCGKTTRRGAMMRTPARSCS